MHALNPVFRSLSLSMLLIIAAGFMLTGCEKLGGGYGQRGWDPGQQSQRPAEMPPSALNLPQAGEPAMDASVIPPEQPVPPARPVVKVGILLPLSGDQKALGEAMLQAAQMALFDIGHNSFELLPRDTGTTLEGGREAARSAIQDGAQLLLGPVFAEAVRGARPVAESANVNMIAFSTDWNLAGGNTFIMGFLPFDQIERVLGYAAAHNVRDLGILAPGTDYGRAVATSTQTIGRRYGMNVAGATILPASTRTLSDTLKAFARYDETRREAAAPYDAVMMAVGGNQAVTVANLLSNYGLPPGRVRRIGTGLLDDDVLATEPNLDGAWFAAPSPRLRRDFERRYQQLYSAKPPRLATLAYDATALAAVLAQRSQESYGATTFDHAAITNPNGFAGIDGIFRFRPDGTAERGLAVLEFRRGTVQVLEDAPQTFQTNTPF